MLRGCSSCAISERPAPLPRPLFAKADLYFVVPLSSSLAADCKLSAVDCLSPLSPIIPVDPRNPPVSPIIPVHTQKQGVHPSSNRTMRSISGLSPARFFSEADLYVAVPLSSSLAVNCQLSAVGCFSPLSPIIPVHTQKQGGGGHFSTHGQIPASITYELYYCMLHATQMQNVGAPTFRLARSSAYYQGEKFSCPSKRTRIEWPPPKRGGTLCFKDA